jgi:serine protease inhibitor
MSDDPIISANARFALKLFSAVAAQDRGKNIFVSPASVALALAMTYNGAAGETQRAMAEALELSGTPLEEINRANAGLLHALATADQQIKLAIANALWAKRGIAFNSGFIQRCKHFYAAEVEELDFADPRAAGQINDWVRKQTSGKIDKIVGQIDSSAILFLLNAIYFKGNWTRQFDKRRTEAGAFTLLDGRQKQHPLMSQSGKYRYQQGKGFQAVSLPYGSRRLSMYIFLPEQDSGLEAFQKTLNSANWNAWMQQFREMEGTVVLPRFKLEYEIKLNAALQSLGMGLAFDAGRADFTGMAPQTHPPIRIDEVRHKTFVEVNEEGTEAAAVTSVGMVLTSFTPERRFSMIVDRPFFCAIRDDQSGAILFMGSVVEP